MTPKETEMTSTVKTLNHTFIAHVHDGKVNIWKDGNWAGRGNFKDNRISDCAAQLGDTPEETESIYCALEMGFPVSCTQIYPEYRF